MKGRHRMRHFNDWLADHITRAVGTMWAAYVFAVLTLVSLPAVIATGSIVVFIQWVGSVFLQLVLLPIIMVGQRKHKAEVRSLHEKHDRNHKSLKKLHEKIDRVLEP